MDKASKITQADRILGILQDGEWHSSLTFARLDRPILSWTRRIFELRQRGHVIAGRDVGNIHFYRLVEGGK